MSIWSCFPKGVRLFSAFSSSHIATLSLEIFNQEYRRKAKEWKAAVNVLWGTWKYVIFSPAALNCLDCPHCSYRNIPQSRSSLKFPRSLSDNNSQLQSWQEGKQCTQLYPKTEPMKMTLKIISSHVNNLKKLFTN